MDDLGKNINALLHWRSSRNSPGANSGSSFSEFFVGALETILKNPSLPPSLQPSHLTRTYPFFVHRVANIRGHLAAAIPPSDQILLLGPPYKVPKDSTLQSEETQNALRLGDMEDDPIIEDEDSTTPRKILASTERSGARRLFLFSKQALSENAPDPPACYLEPMDLNLPTDAVGQSPLNLDPAGSPPLHQALAAYERQSMLYLSQGRVLADGADLRFSACRNCVQEQAVMARALRSAVSNLSDHYSGAARTRAEFTSNFQAKSVAHASLLNRFDSILTDLANIPLHSSLVSIARSSGRSLETLLDTVPVERERAWVQQCQTSHHRLVILFGELDTAFGELGTPASREQEARLDLTAEEEIQMLWSEVEGTAKVIRDSQSQRLGRLTADHQEVVRVIMNAINADSDDEVQSAFTPLRQMSNSSKDIIPSMVTDDAIMKELMEKVADAKTRAMKRMKVRLRDVSVAQSSIQRVLSSVGVLRDALTQQTDNMVHLEHVAELPDSYRDFLSELRRRRAYGHAVTSSSTAMMERLASMRADEVKAREKFLRGPGRHLMPAFFEIFVPTLATPPPLFTPQLPAMVELDTLPVVGHDTIGESSADAVMRGTSTSTLTAESQLQHAGGGQENMMGSAAAGPHETDQHHDQLIVSADEQSGTGLILDTAGGAAADAEVKTLAYENAVLRQALERSGGKPVRAYIEVARAKDGSKVDEAEIIALRKELAEAKVQAKVAKQALETASTADKKTSDKISHSSFAVGDVGLFMPTGRGSGGKRTYLAFHTNCPHRYLSTDSIKGTPDFVLGRIVYQEELVAGEVGTDANPYGLHIGTTFWVLTVEVLKLQN